MTPNDQRETPKIPVINDQGQQSCFLSVKEREHLLVLPKAKKIKTKKYPTLKKIELGKSLPVDADDTVLSPHS